MTIIYGKILRPIFECLRLIHFKSNDNIIVVYLDFGAG